MRYLTACITPLMLAVVPAIASAQVPRDLRDAMEARVNAVWNKDVATWSRFTADEFAVVVPEGKLLTKADRVVALKRETPQAPHAIGHEKVHVYGEAAVRRFLDEDEWVLEVWVRQNGRPGTSEDLLSSAATLSSEQIGQRKRIHRLSEAEAAEGKPNSSRKGSYFDYPHSSQDRTYRLNQSRSPPSTQTRAACGCR